MSKRTDLDAMCRAAGNAQLGTLLVKLVDAVNIIATNLDADTVGAADYVANVTTALGLADDGDFDLDAS